MVVEESSRRRIHKLTIGTLKIIPLVLALISLLNNVLSYFYIDLEVLGHIGSASLFPLIFLYLASYCFQFCEYHRMFLHYVSVNYALSIYDYYIGIPLDNLELFIVNMIIAGICAFIIIYLHLHEKSVE